MIRFKHDDTESWSIATRDCKIFRHWECGMLSAEEAAEKMRVNNELEELSAESFVETAISLGYGKEDL